MFPFGGGFESADACRLVMLCDRDCHLAEIFPSQAERAFSVWVWVPGDMSSVEVARRDGIVIRKKVAMICLADSCGRLSVFGKESAPIPPSDVVSDSRDVGVGGFLFNEEAKRLGLSFFCFDIHECNFVWHF